MTSNEPQPIASKLSEAHRALIRRVCLRVPPLFPLEDMVAVNPFLGYTSEPFVVTHGAFERRLHTDILPDIPTFRRMFADGAFAISDVYAAAREWNGSARAAGGAPEIDPIGRAGS